MNNFIGSLKEPEIEQYLHALLQAAIDGFFVVDAVSDQILYVNDSYCKMSGNSREELHQLHYSEIDSTGTKMTQRLNRCIKDKSDRFESLHKRKNGFLYDVELSVSYLNKSGGMYICFCRDISDRKEYEAHLKHSRNLLQYIIEHDLSSVAVHDRNMRYIYVSQRYLQEASLHGKDIIGKSHYDVFPDLPQKWRDVHKRAMQGEILCAENDLYERADGTVEWTRWECRPWYEMDGTIGGIIVYTEVTTEHKRTEEALQASGTMLRNIIDSSTDYIYVKDRDLRTLVCNDKFANAVGKTPADLIGKTDIENGWDPLFVKGDPVKGIRGFEQDDFSALSGKTLHIIDEPGNVSESVRIFDTIKQPLYADNGEIIGVLGISRDITERKQAEDNLRETRERMQFALSASNIGTWDLDLNNFTIYRTLEHDRIFGYSELVSHWTYETFLQHVHQQDRSIVKTTFQNSLNEQSVCDFECRIIRCDEAVRWIRICGQYRKEENGACFRMTGVVQDITERKIAEEKMNEGYNLLTNLARLVPGVIYQYKLNPDGSSLFPYSSPGMINIYGVTSEEVREDATPVFGRLHPEDHDRIVEAIFESAKTLNTFYCEFRVILPNKGLGWRWSQAHPERTADGGTLWHGIIVDITERKLAQETIAAEKERLAVTLRSIGDGVITTDTRGTVVSINYVAESLTGWSQQEAKGKPLKTIFKIIHEITRQPCDDPVQKVLSTGQIIELANHTVLVARDGTERIIADSGAPIKDKQNDIIGVVLVFRDMTEKQKLLDIVQRTAKLDSLGILAGGIAHDFNNLLGGIFGYIDMALDIATEETVSRYLSKALNTIDRARGLTQQLLTFAKGGAPQKKTGHLFPFIHETAHFALSGSNVSCSISVPDDLWVCNFDKNQIGQVVDNIVINAQEAMPEGGFIEIGAENVIVNQGMHSTLSYGNYVKISFKDKGVGMPREIITKIFDPFYTTKMKGHGLGLATSYSILNRHGGCIEVESEPGKGSTFHIYLPASAESVSDSPGSSATMHQGSGTILVMDDEAVMREAISDMLKSLGYTVITVENGKDAIEYFTSASKANHSLTAMIFDLTIPGAMGGKEAIKEIRTRCPTIPVFVSSGYAEDPIMSHPGTYGFTASICKPFRRSELADMLNKHLY